MTSHELRVDRAPARRLRTRSERICAGGFGYVGLPLAVRFARRGHEVDGFDGVPVATPHDELEFDLDVLAAKPNEDPLVVDPEGALAPDDPSGHDCTYRRL